MHFWIDSAIIGKNRRGGSMWELRLARQDELEKIFALYAARVRWMDAAGIHQWNDTKYLERFPLGYYEDMQ